MSDLVTCAWVDRRAAAILCLVAAGCGPVIQTSRGVREEVLQRRLLARRPIGEEPLVRQRRVTGGTELAVTLHRSCELAWTEQYRSFEQIDERAGSDSWWAATAAGVVVAAAGAVLIARAPRQPTSGTDSDGKPNNPRTEQYLLGGTALAVGVGLFLPMTPWPRDHTVLRAEGTRQRNERVGCGDTPYVGPLAVARGFESFTAFTDARGRLRLNDNVLSGQTGKLTVTAKESGIEAQLREDPSRVVP